MAESFERITGFKEIGTVTIEACAHVVKMNISPQHLRITVLVLVITQLVSMYQINSLIGYLGLAWLLLPRWRH
jgi:hypothetical protein